MPELPEVETIRRDLERAIVGERIVSIDVSDARVLRQPQKDFVARLKGQTIESIDRRGKALIQVGPAGTGPAENSGSADDTPDLSIAGRVPAGDHTPAVRRASTTLDVLDLGAARSRLACVPRGQEDRDSGHPVTEDRRGDPTGQECRPAGDQSDHQGEEEH